MLLTKRVVSYFYNKITRIGNNDEIIKSPELVGFRKVGKYVLIKKCSVTVLLGLNGMFHLNKTRLVRDR